jgi:hypothetical protein
MAGIVIKRDVRGWLIKGDLMGASSLLPSPRPEAYDFYTLIARQENLKNLPKVTPCHKASS